MFGIKELLTRPTRTSSSGLDGFFERASDDHGAPGYWVATVARARRRGLRFEELQFHPNQRAYAQALRIEPALGQADCYPHDRKTVGVRYSPLVVLDDVDRTNEANHEINACIRSMFDEQALQPFVHELVGVVGDMHDNVWSHGRATGLSMAQRWKKPHSDGQSNIEFALADCGHGFLAELQRAGIARHEAISSHDDAIRWCIKQGNSTKSRPTDAWEQALPWDAVGNPMGVVARAREKDNNHLGLGLHKLCLLVRNYGGHLWLASGDAMLIIDPAGIESMVPLSCAWEGVVLACRFATDSVRGRADIVLTQAQAVRSKAEEAFDEAVSQLLGRSPPC